MHTLFYYQVQWHVAALHNEMRCVLMEFLFTGDCLYFMHTVMSQLKINNNYLKLSSLKLLHTWCDTKHKTFISKCSKTLKHQTPQ